MWGERGGAQTQRASRAPVASSLPLAGGGEGARRTVCPFPEAVLSWVNSVHCGPRISINAPSGPLCQTCGVSNLLDRAKHGRSSTTSRGPTPLPWAAGLSDKVLATGPDHEWAALQYRSHKLRIPYCLILVVATRLVAAAHSCHGCPQMPLGLPIMAPRHVPSMGACFFQTAVELIKQPATYKEAAPTEA